MRDWLPPMLRVWAKQKRRLLAGGISFNDGARHIDGWPASSPTAKALLGGVTGGSGVHTQQFDEVYSGDGLTVWRALCHAPFEIRLVVHVHYVVGGNSGVKAKAMGVSRTSYWIQLDSAHHWIAGFLSGEAERPAARAFAPSA